MTVKDIGLEVTNANHVANAINSSSVVSPMLTPTYELEAIMGGGSPFTWSASYIAVAIGDWISIETASSSSSASSSGGGRRSPSHRDSNIKNKGASTTSAGSQKKQMIHIGSEVYSLDNQADMLTVLTEKSLQLWIDIQSGSPRCVGKAALPTANPNGNWVSLSFGTFDQN